MILPRWIARPVAATARCISPLVDLCYPSHCAACGAFCEADGLVCSACDAKLREVEDVPACILCGKPLAYDGAPCPWCLGKGLPHYDRVARLGLHSGVLRRLIHHVKYHRRWPLAETLAQRLATRASASAILLDAQVIVPVPLHLRRQFERGYNQAEVMARSLRRACDAKVVRAVVRVRHTPTQTRLRGLAPRRENVKGAFALVNPNAIAGRHVVVVDDVTTSGATLHELATQLRPAQPATLSALVLAVADPKGRAFRAT